MPLKANTITAMTTDLSVLLRLQGWLSPAFPIGAYTYSHGLEALVEDGSLKTVDQLIARLTSLLSYGAGWTDGLLVKLVMEAETEADLDHLLETAWSLRGTFELGFESNQQGQAFLKAVQATWPMPELDALQQKAAHLSLEVPLPIAYAVAAKAIGATAEIALSQFLMAFVHNLISAALRAVPLGQTHGQQAVAALEPVVVHTTPLILAATWDDLGNSAIAHDLASITHETQYARIFRS